MHGAFGRTGGIRELGEPASWLVGAAAIFVALAGLPPWRSGLLAVAVLVGFTAHEAAHRFVARRGGMRAEYIVTVEGVIITIVSALFPFKVLAPGYVRVWGYRFSPRWAFYSVIAGPASNIVLAAISLALATLLNSTGSYALLREMAWVNAWLALFNLIPIRPLDGQKIAEHNWRIWAIMTMGAGTLYVAVTLVY